MRPLAALLAVVLPLAPFVFYLDFSTFPEGFIIGLMALTFLMGFVAVIRRTRVGLAGLFSALVSAGLAMLGGGYVPYLAHVELGAFSASSAPLLGLSVSAALYGHYMGNVYEGASRLSGTLKKMNYESSDLRELDKMALWSAAIGAGVLLLSYGLYVVLSTARVYAIGSSLLALAVFLVIYGIAMASVRRHVEGEGVEQNGRGNSRALRKGAWNSVTYKGALRVVISCNWRHGDRGPVAGK
ncbi:MAG: hypothetical protein ACP5SK_04075 [Thermoprotei archaeon]